MTIAEQRIRPFWPMRSSQSMRSSGLTSRRHVDYGRVRSAICPAG